MLVFKKIKFLGSHAVVGTHEDLSIGVLFTRGVSDVGFPIFADTYADFAFKYPRILQILLY